MVRWYSPVQLANTGAQVLFSLILETWSDKREIQAALPADPPHDLSNRNEIWLDFVADLGDGWDSTYAIASLLARPQLELDDRGQSFPTQRGNVLVMGGDLVYPTSKIVDYENRMLGPYRTALPWAEGPDHPDLFVIPGNHDWYDGLTNFMRIFCQRRWVGGWKTHQSRSYFALKLPHRWWLWGIDLQLDHYIDDPQIRYFQDLGKQYVQAGDRLIIVTAEPSWIYAGSKGPLLYRNFDYFDRKVVRPSGAQLTAALTGDLHHYCRFQEVGGSRQLITAGGGGAFLHPTHHLPKRLGKELKPHPDSDVPEFERVGTTSPTAAQSVRLLLRTLLMPVINPEFAALIALIPILLLWSLQPALSGGATNLINAAHRASLGDLVSAWAHSPGSVLIAVLIVVALVGFAKARGLKKWGPGVAHGMAQVAAMLAMIWLAGWIAGRVALPEFPATLLLLGLVAVLGGAAAAVVFGAYLASANLLLGMHDNEAFSALRIADFKNFLRLHFDESGGLTIYPVGVERVTKPQPHLIETPIRIAPPG